ncbi:MAG: M48 family metalloprotease [Candidatus Omnitrophica bacterium]|nr:M48 family metalloprotease [Candidatus Omnitrophota bacterium]
MRNKVIFCLSLTVLLFVAGCITTEYNIATNTQDIYFYSTEKEVNLGKNISQAIEKEMPISKDPLLNKKIWEIGEKLVKVCDRKEINYYFYIIDKDEKNAFSIPGGYVYIFKGLLDILDNDSQIAFVLGHEIGHIVARHSIKRLQASLGYNFLILASSQIKASGNISQIQGISLILATILSGYSQEDEFLADSLALKYLQRAGFPPQAGIEVLKKLEQAQEKEPLREIAYFRSHPFVSQRIKRIKQELGLPLEFRDIINY